MIVNEKKLIALLIILAIITLFVGLQLGFLISLSVWGFHVFLRYKGLLPKKNLKGEHVLITGGGMGIGRELALQLSSKGCRITIAELNIEQAKKTQKDIQKLGCKEVQIFECDVSNEDQVQKTFEDAVKTFGEIDILINNAGIVCGKKFTENSFQPMKKVVEVNTIAHFQTILLVLKQMIKRNHGHIVTISSCAGYLPGAAIPEYNASKYGAVGIHEALSMELQGLKSKVSTTLICPWFIRTNMTKDVSEDVPFGILDLDKAVQRMVSAIEQDEYIVVIPWAVNILIFLRQVLPPQISQFLSKEGKMIKAKESAKTK